VFVELNELRYVVVHAPVHVLAHQEAWSTLDERLRCAFLVGGQDRVAWERWARGRRCLVLEWSPDYLIPTLPSKQRWTALQGVASSASAAAWMLPCANSPEHLESQLGARKWHEGCGMVEVPVPAQRAVAIDEHRLVCHIM
jgi:hypothetical protein